jgi:hypothetical protein
MSKGPKGAADFLMPRANSARGKVLGALPRSPARGTPPETPAPFPFAPIFQNGPRRPGFAGENLFNPRKDSPPPRLKRAPWTAAGRSEDLLVTRERGQMQRSTPPQPAVACRLPLAGPDRREMIVVDQTSTGGNHPKQVYRFQDHLVLETLLHFRIILGLEYARTRTVFVGPGRFSSRPESGVEPHPDGSRPRWRLRGSAACAGCSTTDQSKRGAPGPGAVLRSSGMFGKPLVLAERFE